MISLLRPATALDCEILAPLINKAYRGDSSRTGWTTEADLLDGQRTDADSLRALIAKPGSTLLMAFDENQRLIGSVHLEKKSDVRCYLGMFTIDPDLQAQGIGKEFLKRAELYAREVYGASEMEMTVITLRHELLAWYERRSYKRTGRCVPFPTDPRFGILKVPFLEMEVLEKSFT